MKEHYVVRPVRASDIDSFMALVEQTDYGLSSLPKNRTYLEDRINNSTQSFIYHTKKPSGGGFLFVMEERSTRRLVGTCGVMSKVGGFEPFYAYHIESISKRSDSPELYQDLRILHLRKEHSGPCEIGSLFLLPECRKKGLGALLVISRFLFMAEYPNAFDPRVVAKLRGVIDDEGCSPFWEGVGRHFFGIDYHLADYHSALDKRLIADFLPPYPVYVNLLPKAAQEVVGAVHPQTRGADSILKSQGFVDTQMVDLFEAGPILECRRDEILSIRESRRVTIGHIADQVESGTLCLIANTKSDYRACMGSVVCHDSTIDIPVEVADLLEVGVGDRVRVFGHAKGLG